MTAPFAILTRARNLLVFAVTLFLVAGNCACRRGSRGNANANGPSSVSEPGTEQSKREAKALVDQGKELYRNDQDEQAAEVFLQATQLNPDLAEAHLRLGMAYAALDRRVEADESYKKAVELYKKQVQADPKNGENFFYLGQAYSALHQDESAANAFRQATKLKPDDEEAFYQLGKAEIRLAHYPEATSALQKALELKPDYDRATDALEEAQEGARRIKEGKKHAEEMLKKQQENANANGNANSNTKPAPKRSPSKPW
jgi:tetratricopeptide (TPR) repeat protein